MNCDIGLICDVEGCTRQAEYLRIIKTKKGTFQFNLCKDCNKIEFTIESFKTINKRNKPIKGNKVNQ